jgi:nucleotide-binding universal stress UspA family protein
LKRFKNILYIVESETSLEDSVATKVISLARINSATVTVVRVIEDGPFEQLSRTFFQKGKQLTSLVIEQAEKDIHSFVSSSIWNGVQVSSEILQGTGFISVIRKVLKDGHDLVIKRGSAPRGVDQLAMRLIRKCPCPIWVIQGSASGELRRVLGAIDAASESNETKLLNKKIVELSHSLAQREEGEAHYLYSWYLPSELILQGPRFNLSDAEVQQMKEQLEHEGRNNVCRILESAQIEPRHDHIHIKEGKTDEVIEKALKNLQIEVLVLGTIGRSGIPGLLIGNTVEKLLARVQCSVLAVKPDDYESPVIL